MRCAICLAVTTFATLLLIAACQRQQQDSHSVNDFALGEAVRNSFAANHDTKGATAEVEIHAKDGVVTLSGKVDTVVDKALAEDIARRTSGVTNVVNQIVVAEPVEAAAPEAPFDEQAVRAEALKGGEQIGKSSDDARIYDAVRRQLVAHAGTSKREIFVDVVNRNVTLRGRFVGTSAARDEAVKAARNTKGVNAVNDQMVVSANSSRP